MAGFGSVPRTGTPRSTPSSSGVGVVSQVGVGGGSVGTPPQSEILKLLQGGGGSVPFVPAPPVPKPAAVQPAAPIVNTAQANPLATSVANNLADKPADAVATGVAGRLATKGPDARATGIVDTLAERARGDMGLGRELQRGIQDVRNKGLAGIRGDQLSRVARGVSGTGIDAKDASRQSDQERMDVNRMVNDRSIAAEGMRNDLLQNTANLSMGVAGQDASNQLNAGNLSLSASGQQSANQMNAGNLALGASGQQLQAQGQNAATALGQQQLGLQAQQQATQQANEQWRMQQEAAASQRNNQLQNLQTLLNLFT